MSKNMKAVSVCVDLKSPFEFDQSKHGWFLEQETEGVLFGSMLLDISPIRKGDKTGVSGWQEAVNYVRARKGLFTQHCAEEMARRTDIDPILEYWERLDVLSIPFFGTRWIDPSANPKLNVKVPVLSLVKSDAGCRSLRMGFREVGNAITTCSSRLVYAGAGQVVGRPALSRTSPGIRVSHR